MASMPRKIRGYVFGEKLGSGSFAEVYKAFHCNDNNVVAIKCVEKKKLSKTALNNLVNEIGIFKRLDHENIVKLKDFAWDDCYIYIIMEYCSGGCLSNFIYKHKRLPENICQKFLQQLAKAMKYLRDQMVSHFDLKPQNILIESKKGQILKIADFGLAQIMSDNDIATVVKGSPLYMAPEIALNHEYDARADIWSIGIILYECLFGKAPYSSKTIDELIDKIKNEKPIEIPTNVNISPKCRDFLTGCLERNISKRTDFDAFFSHPFVDLEHSPSSESFNRASVHFNAAIAFEKEFKFQEAFTSYNEGVRYLIPLLHYESDAVKCLNLKRKITEYIKKMEILKQNHKLVLNNDALNDIQNVTLPSNICATFQDNTELKELTHTTPQMAAAIEIAETAELYEYEQKKALALEKYELALGKLLALLQNEPNGKRRTILLGQINIWMENAENIKLELSEVKTKAILKEDNLDRTCSLQ